MCSYRLEYMPQTSRPALPEPEAVETEEDRLLEAYIDMCNENVRLLSTALGIMVGLEAVILVLILAALW